MNKLIILSLLVISAALTAGARGKKRRQNRGGKLRDILAESGSQSFDLDISPTSLRGGRRSEDLIVENQVFDSVGGGVGRGGLRRRGGGVRNVERALTNENAAAQGIEEGAVAESSLKAGNRDLSELEALLQKKQAKQEVSV